MKFKPLTIILGGSKTQWTLHSFQTQIYVAHILDLAVACYENRGK